MKQETADLLCDVVGRLETSIVARGCPGDRRMVARAAIGNRTLEEAQVPLAAENRDRRRTQR